MLFDIWGSQEDVVIVQRVRDTEVREFRYLWNMKQLSENEKAKHIPYENCVFVLPEEVSIEEDTAISGFFNLLLCEKDDADRIVRQFPGSNIAYIANKEPKRARKVFDAIQKSYKPEEAVYKDVERLTYLGMEGTPLHEILNELYSIIDNQIVILDSRLGEVAERRQEVAVDSRFDRDTVDYDVASYLNSKLEEGYRDFSDCSDRIKVEKLEYATDGSLTSGTFIWKDGNLCFFHVMNYLIARMDHYGYLCTEAYTRPLTTSDLFILGFASVIIANKLWEGNNDYKNEETQNTFVTFNGLAAAICMGEVDTKKKIIERMRDYKLDLKDEFLLIVIRRKEEEVSDVRFESELRYASDSCGTSFAFKVQNNHCVMISVSDAKKARNNVNRVFDTFLKKHNAYGALSRGFKEIAALKERYDTVNDYLDIMESLDVNTGICKMENYILHQLLHIYSQTYDAEVLMHSMLPELEQMSNSKVDFYETCKAYVKHNRSIMAAAQELNIHYNTMKYRINKIIEQTNVDFEDEDVFTWVKISFYIKDLIEQKTTYGSQESQ